MSKTFTETARLALNGPTMGARWSALVHVGHGFDPAPLKAACQAAVDAVDMQMSTWRPQSDLMRLSAAPVGDWVHVPTALFTVLRLGLDIGRASGGAFDVGMGDAVTAWGFGATEASAERIQAAAEARRTPSHKVLDLDEAAGAVRKRAAVAFDLNGIAKGFGVDQLARTLTQFGLDRGLVGIDGEMRALGSRPGGTPWTIAVETPDPARRAAHSILALEDAAVATSGDYRHWVEVLGRRLSHTMDPRRGRPLAAPPASVTVVARTCAEADAWATALMVLGQDAGGRLAGRLGLDALFLARGEDGGIRPWGTGRLFDGTPVGDRA